jgi:D-sedoheptulose 7-phosphate isomerase
MDYYKIIAENFQGTIEAVSLSVDRLATPIEMGSQLMTRALLEDRKIFACGNGVDAALAQLLTSNLLSRFEQERPALPAFSLCGDSATVTAIANTSGAGEIFSRQVRALGQEGDVLLCISSSSGNSNLLRAVQAAHERNMCVITLSNSADHELGTLLQPDDVELSVDAARQTHVVELHTMVIHCLCQLIDHNLFGAYTRD